MGSAGGSVTYVDLEMAAWLSFYMLGYNICLSSSFLHVCSSQLKNCFEIQF